MRDYHRLYEEIQVLEKKFGAQRVFWDEQGNWVMVRDLPLPPGLNKQSTNVIVIIPEHYGNGAPLRDAFIDPDLRVRAPKTGKFVEIPHYFQEFPYEQPPIETKEDWACKKWRYICLHQPTDRWPQGSILNYLSNVYKFLAEPFRDWQATFSSYKEHP
ncbi:MAG: hypothetical protein BZ151_08870 [Desulfobacca sp. 4484_104]|nr:MAG: hypothetical protein BZ151_08870 [Desulfobacca sp. 4484_104]